MDYKVIIFVAVALVVLLFIWQYSRRHEEIPISIMVMGFPEAGKTVLLATMYNQLSIPGKDGFSLYMSDLQKRNKLDNIYKQVADPKEDFPQATSTGGVTDWEFTGRIKAVSHSYDLIKFTYSDYAGEHLKDLRKETLTDPDYAFARRFHDADIVLGILDGAKVLKIMNNESSETFYEETRFMLTLMTDRDKPVHLVLTKWDLLQDKYKLHEIITRLEHISHFKNFIDSHTALGKLRIIPVSSVGKGFTHEDKGYVKKTGNVPIQPFQAQMPIACILPDLVNARKKRLRNQPWIVKVLFFLLSKFSLSLNLWILTASIDHPFDNLSREEYIDETPNLKEYEAASLKSIRNEKNALKYIYRFFLRTVSILEFDFPESDVTRLKRIGNLR